MPRTLDSGGPITLAGFDVLKHLVQSLAVAVNQATTEILSTSPYLF